MAYIAVTIIISFTLILLYYLIYVKLFTVKKEIKRKHYTVSYSYDKRKNKVYNENGLDINIKREYYEKFTKRIINILRKYSKKDECGIEYTEYLNKKGKHIHKYKSCGFKEAFKVVKQYWDEDQPEIIIEEVYRQYFIFDGTSRIKFYKYSNSVLVTGNYKFINYVLNRL